MTATWTYRERKRERERGGLADRHLDIHTHTDRVGGISCICGHRAHRPLLRLYLREKMGVPTNIGVCKELTINRHNDSHLPTLAIIVMSLSMCHPSLTLTRSLPMQADRVRMHPPTVCIHSHPHPPPATTPQSQTENKTATYPIGGDLAIPFHPGAKPGSVPWAVVATGKSSATNRTIPGVDKLFFATSRIKMVGFCCVVLSGGGRGWGG
jgi:hypothetical protein